MKKSVISLAILLVLSFGLSSLAQAFCILTNGQGYYRKYVSEDIPFVYQLHVSTPDNYYDAIDAGAEVWEAVESSFWEFDRGANTSSSSLSWNGENLLFFDIQGVNFPPNTDAIAFSSTFTVGSGSEYHAVESDLIWNARDFTPSPDGDPNLMDIQSIIAHEFGHHLGLGHQGTPGSPPGCGLTLPAATMYGTVAAGDTTNRTLHIHDVAGVSAIYPVWKMQGFVLDATNGMPLEGVGLVSDEIYASIVGPAEPIPGSSMWQRPGEPSHVILTGPGGYYNAVIMKQEFTIATEGYFGYQAESATITFDPPGGIGETQTINQDFLIYPSPQSTISGHVVTADGTPVTAEVEAYALGDKLGIPDGPVDTATTDSEGQFVLDVPAFEAYELIITSEMPYYIQTKWVDYLPEEGTDVTIEVEPADVLLINDDPQMAYADRFKAAFDSLGAHFYEWKIAADGDDIPLDMMSSFNQNIMIWYTGDASTNVLTAAEIAKLNAFLDSGGRLFLTGQNIAEALDAAGNSFLADRLHVNYVGANATPVIDPIGDHPLITILNELGRGVILSGVDGNQTSMDLLEEVDGGLASTAFNYFSSGSALVTVEDPANNSKVVFSGFGFEGMRQGDNLPFTSPERLLGNILTWFDMPLAIEAPPDAEIDVFSGAELRQNYPNPFNPATQIAFSVPARSTVELAVYNTAGQRISTLIAEDVEAGSHEVTWRGTNEAGEPVTSGVYFYQLKTGNETLTRRMVLLK